MPTKPDTETVRHPLAVAWDEWLASSEGQEARAANTLPHNTNHYLENRLHRAFVAGTKAATISPSDFEQLIQLRKVGRDAVATIQKLVNVLDLHTQRGMAIDADHVASALNEALTLQERKVMPETTSQLAAETLEEIAERITSEWLDQEDWTAGALTESILSCLRNERERAAKLTDEFARRLRTVGSHLVAAGVEVLASEIRSGK